MDQLLIALDVASGAEATALARRLGPLVGGFKIGGQLFTAEGPAIVRAITSQGYRVFLDLKFHDIPSAVAGAVRAAAELGVWMLTVHTVGGEAMLRAAMCAARESKKAPRIIGVTVLTSLDAEGLRASGVERALSVQVEALTHLAKAAGLDGVVASPHEIQAIRRIGGPALTIVTPGIRAVGSAPDDQARTMTASEALRAGASYLVVGRPVVAAQDPVAAAKAIVAEVQTSNDGTIG